MINYEILMLKVPSKAGRMFDVRIGRGTGVRMRVGSVQNRMRSRLSRLVARQRVHIGYAITCEI